ncbi:MAG: hypothetical protein VCA35_10260 [Roseibacillus sp.]
MARKGSKQKPVLVRYWFFAIFLTWIPLINLVAVPLLVLFGKDQSKKNYYLALILWIVLIVALNVPPDPGGGRTGNHSGLIRIP